MQISLTLEELMKLQQSLSQKDIEIALLKKEVEELRNKVGTPENAPTDGQFITLNLDNVCKVIEKMKGNPGWMFFFCYFLRQMMPEGMPALASKRIDAVASLEGPSINFTTSGDIRIDGNFNSIHDNDSVNL